MVKTIHGDLVLAFKNNDIDALCHGCNCFHTMTKGIAKSISSQYPDVLQTDIDHGQKGDMKRLGDFSLSIIDRNGINGVVYNVYSQFNFGRIYGIPIDYSALEQGLSKVRNHIETSMSIFNSNRDRKLLGLPKIGCGLAGGKWSIVEPLIERLFEGAEFDVVIFSYEN